jgi:type IV secretion system protein VirB11
MKTHILLENHLQPLQHWLEHHDVSEISINRPGEVWIERHGVISQETIPELTWRHLKDLAQLIATFSEQTLSPEQPLLSAVLPQGHRVQIVLPPAVNEETVGISIRKPSLLDFDLNWYAQQGGLALNSREQLAENVQKQLLQLHQEHQHQEFLKLAIRERRNILISGGTSTGKTTFLNALLKQIPATERIITIEDVPEIHVTQPNSLSLFASRGRQGRSQIDVQDLVEASLRLRPDRIIIGELRGGEAFSFLRAVNTGHPGSMATLHADTPLLALEQLVLMVMQKNLGLSREQIENYIHLVLDIVVQLKKGHNGMRYVSEIYLLRQ